VPRAVGGGCGARALPPGAIRRRKWRVLLLLLLLDGPLLVVRNCRYWDWTWRLIYGRECGSSSSLAHSILLRGMQCMYLLAARTHTTAM
jgi:hypothetical protein